MHLASGVALVLVTWSVTCGLIISLGLLPALGSSRRLDRPEAVRGALWWGLLVLALFAVAVNLILPLHSQRTGALLMLLVAVLGVPGWWLWRGRPTGRVSALRRSWPVLAGVAATIVALAVAALGPVTNYDSGLYHLQAIRYAADYATVPGLASVFFPFGYATAEFPLAAVMGVGPWGFDGFRLLNGLVIVLALVDLLLRWRRPRPGPGAFVMLAGMSVVAITMVPLADYWVTSPTQDSAVLVLTVVASAYVADIVSNARTQRFIGVLGALLIALVILRPTMIAYAGTAGLVALAVVWRRWPRGERSEFPRWGSVVGLAAATAAVVMTARDYVLSGWLQYPLSLHAFHVSWLAPDPMSPRLATLGAARDPDNLWVAAQSWGWIGPWLRRLPGQWETYATLGLAIVALIIVTIASRETTLRGRALLVAMVPSLVAVAFWWAFTPPSFRFGWGPVFTTVTLPIGWAVWRLARSRGQGVTGLAMGAGAAVMVIVAALTLVLRVDYDTMTQNRSLAAWAPLTYRVAPVAPGEVTVTVNESGLEVRVPQKGEQCWLAFPTCSPQLPGTLRLRGDDIQSGYLP